MAPQTSHKRITLFPKNGQSLTQKELMGYITPMGELNFLPSVTKGMTVKITENGKLKVDDAWSVDFNNESDNIKVSVTIDRVDIIGTADSEWLDFFDKAKGVIEIVKLNNPQGMSRVALGAKIMRPATEDESNRIFGSKVDTDSYLQEKSERTAYIETLRDSEGVEILKFNSLRTDTLFRTRDEIVAIRDYDINTVVDSDEEVVTSSIAIFLTEGVNKLVSYEIQGKE